MNFEYILALGALCIAYTIVFRLMKHFTNLGLTNFIFGCLTFIPYILLCAIVYEDVGLYDWNFQNLLPVANVSPFMFSIIPVLLLIPKRAKRRVYLLISLLCVGMFLSSVFGCVYNAVINYKFHPHFMLDYVSHFSLSLFGIYLIRSRQVDFNTKSCIKSGAIIVGVATVMMILNIVFDTSFFGLSLNGKHNIYNNVLVDSSYLSALLYYIGLIGVLALGYIACQAVNKSDAKRLGD